MELSDAGDDRSRYEGSPPAREKALCRDHLTALLSPFVSEGSATLAADLIERFGSLAALLAAPAERQAKAVAGRPEVLKLLAAVRAAMLHALRPEAFLGSAMSTTAAVADYLRLEMGYEPAEQVRILFLGSGNRLIADEVLFRGTIDSAPIHARPIVHRALDLCATALIIVHNHPSGDASPSQADLQETHELRAALRAVDVVVHDHIIVARSGWTSLRARGLM